MQFYHIKMLDLCPSLDGTVSLGLLGLTLEENDSVCVYTGFVLFLLK